MTTRKPANRGYKTKKPLELGSKAKKLTLSCNVSLAEAFAADAEARDMTLSAFFRHVYREFLKGD